jgi:hypothetical protein
MKLRLPVVLLIAGVTAACTSDRYQPEPVAPARETPPAPADSMGGTSYRNMTEFGRGLFRSRDAKGNGEIRIDGDVIRWANADDPDRSFSLRAGVLKDVWLTCAKRPGENLCLEVSFRTLTGLEYHFRDENWAGGENSQIMRIYAYLKAGYPSIQYREETVDEVK